MFFMGQKPSENVLQHLKLSQARIRTFVVIEPMYALLQQQELLASSIHFRKKLNFWEFEADRKLSLNAIVSKLFY